MMKNNNSTIAMYDALKKEATSQRMEFSLICGNNYYQIPSPAKVIDSDDSFLAMHVQSETIVKITPIGVYDTSMKDDFNMIAWHQAIISKSMPQDICEWPVDMIEYIENKRVVIAYVYPVREYSGYISIKELLYQERTSKKLDWRNKDIKEVCRNFLSVFCKMRQNDFYYNDFNMQRILYHPDTKKIHLRYQTNLRLWENVPILNILSSNDMDVPALKREAITVKRLAKEFLPPYIHEHQYILGNIDDYAISSILFRLMIGRLPYEGRALTKYGTVFDPLRDTDSLSHDDYFTNYHQYPLFIFDHEDESNALGDTLENNLPKERWEQLPDIVKDMFINSLGRINIENFELKEGFQLYSPEEWLENLEKYCWSEDKTL